MRFTDWVEKILNLNGRDIGLIILKLDFNICIWRITSLFTKPQRLAKRLSRSRMKSFVFSFF